MMVVVVNVVVRGGWLEFLTRVEFDKEGEFDVEEEAVAAAQAKAEKAEARAVARESAGDPTEVRTKAVGSQLGLSRPRAALP